MKIIDCVQGELSWHLARWGVPSASEFDRIMTPKTCKLAAAATEYIAELIGDRLQKELWPDGPPWGFETFMNSAMRHGVEYEPEARNYYRMDHSCGEEVREVGVVVTDDSRWGCSPDGLVGDDGILELKCPNAKTQIGYLLANELPSEYKCQVHGQLIVTGAKWCDFLSYAPGCPPFCVRVKPDDFTMKLRTCLELFDQQLRETEARIRGMQ